MVDVLTREQLSKVLEDITRDLGPGEPRYVMMYACQGRGKTVTTSPTEGLCDHPGCLCADLKQAMKTEVRKLRLNLLNEVTMSLVAKMKEQMELVEVNATAFSEKGNKAAGTRARKAALELKKLAHELRGAISAKKNA